MLKYVSIEALSLTTLTQQEERNTLGGRIAHSYDDVNGLTLTNTIFAALITAFSMYQLCASYKQKYKLKEPSTSIQKFFSRVKKLYTSTGYATCTWRVYTPIGAFMGANFICGLIQIKQQHASAHG